MGISTRCPECGTTFVVVPDQLRVRSGLVRCGECAAVFDGYTCRVGQAEPVPPRRPMPPAVLRNRADMLRHAAVQAPYLPLAREGAAWEEHEGIDGSDGPYATGAVDAPYGTGTTGTPGASDAMGANEAADANGAGRDDQAAPAYTATRAWLPPASAGGFTALSPGGSDFRDPDFTDPDLADPDRCELPGFLDEEAARRQRLQRSLWALGAVLGVALLAGQLVLQYRHAIATQLPLLRPALTWACQPLGCTVGYVRRPELIAIMSSSLQPAAGIGAGLTLNVVLRNLHAKPQMWPALVLDLTDFSDTVIARRVLLPAQYLPAGLAGAPFGAGSEVSLAIGLTVQGLRVNGYQLDTFFP